MIGANVFMGIRVHIACPCLIKDDVMLASNVAFVGGDHRFDQADVPMNRGGRGRLRRIVIEEEAWIGHGAIILAGVHIGRGAIVGAGSVVTKNIPACAIWGGNPARFLRGPVPDRRGSGTAPVFSGLAPRTIWLGTLSQTSLPPEIECRAKRPEADSGQCQGGAGYGII